MKTRYLFSFVLALWALALSAETHWSFSYHQFQYDMTIYFELSESGSAINNFDNYEVAAFVGDDCRGIGKFETQIGSHGTTLSYGFLKVYSNVAEGETVAFRIYDRLSQKELEIKNVSISFVSASAIGYPSEPLVLAFERLFEIGDVDDDGQITAQDALLILKAVAGNVVLTPNQIRAGDVNGDGNITAQDASLILQYIAGKISW